MNQRMIRWAALLLTALLLVGCAKKQTETAAPEPENAEPPVREAETVEVENNGGDYVRLNDRIYFRRYGKDAPAKGAVYGEFLTDWAMRDGESELMVYTPATGELTPLYTETGRGELWYGDGGFYLCEWINQEHWVVWYAAEGGRSEVLCPGRPLGVTDGGLLAVERTAYLPAYHTVYAFYRDGDLLAEASTEDNMAFAGLTDEGLFLLGTAYPAEGGVARTFWQVTPEGQLLRLGTLPDKEEDAYVYDVQPDRFLSAGGRVVLGVGYYAGTGHFLDMFSFAEAAPGQEDSLRMLPEEADGADGTANDELPRVSAAENGDLVFSPALPGELRVGWDEMGALELWEDDHWQLLSERFAPQLSGGWGYCRIVQQMDYVDGAAYVTLACAHVSPADAVGWREAYALLDMLYLKVERDGTVRELSRVDHDAELYGEVWFLEGANTVLWQQLSTTDGEGYYVSDYVYAIPLAEDAWWEGGWEAVFDGTTGLLPYDYGEGEADYYGYPRPDAEPAGELCLSLDCDGNITALSHKAPDAVLAVSFDVPENELSGAAETIQTARRDSDEDTPWFWAKLRVLENGVRLRVERTKEPESTPEQIALSEGEFIAGETLCDLTLDRGEFVAVRVSLPWHPELRVTAGKDGAWGSYVFGEDNYLHLGTEDSVHPELTLAAYPPPNASDYSGEGLRQALSGNWFYRLPDGGEAAALVNFTEDGKMTVSSGEEPETAAFSTELDRLYADEWDAPDLLCLRTGDGGSTGDYLVEVLRTDGEELLHLTQANNGDGALSRLLPGAEDSYDFVLVRDRGIGATGARRRDVTIPAEVARYDRDEGVCWLREAKASGEWEDGSARLLSNVNAPCLAYPCAVPAASVLETGGNPEHPMMLCNVTIDPDGVITWITAQ